MGDGDMCRNRENLKQGWGRPIGVKPREKIIGVKPGRED